MDAEFRALVISTQGTLSDSECQEIAEFIEAREFKYALETLCGFLVDRNRRVTPDLYIRIHALGERLEDFDPYLLESVKAIVID